MKKFLCIAMSALTLTSSVPRVSADPRFPFRGNATADATNGAMVPQTDTTGVVQRLYFCLGIISEGQNIYKNFFVPAFENARHLYFRLTDKFVDEEEVLNNLRKYFLDIKGQESAKRMVIGQLMAIMKNIAMQTKVGHIIYLYGPSGVGKTMMAEGIAKSILGDRFSKQCRIINSSNITVKDHGNRAIKEQLFGSMYYERDNSLIGPFLKDHSYGVMIINEYDKFASREIDEVFRSILDQGELAINEKTKYSCEKIIFIITSNEKSKCLTTEKEEKEEKEDGVENDKPTEKVEDKDVAVRAALVAIGGFLKQEGGYNSVDENGNTTTKHDPSFLNRFQAIEFSGLDDDAFDGIFKDFICEQKSYYNQKYHIELEFEKDCIEAMKQYAKESTKQARVVNDLDNVLSSACSEMLLNCREEGIDIKNKKFLVSYDASAKPNGEFKLEEIKNDGEISENDLEEFDIDDERDIDENCTCNATPVIYAVLGIGSTIFLSYFMQ